MTEAVREAIRAVYEQLGAPEWAAPNLDALSDVLRDLSWLPEGEVALRLPDLEPLGADGAGRLVGILLQAVAETADGPRPVRLTG